MFIHIIYSHFSDVARMLETYLQFPENFSSQMQAVGDCGKRMTLVKLRVKAIHRTLDVRGRGIWSEIGHAGVTLSSTRMRRFRKVAGINVSDGRGAGLVERA
jgi:hypothetical protein